jgi:hypothetical protein
LLKRKEGKGSSTDGAVAERPGAADDFSGSTEELFAEIRRLTETARAQRDRSAGRRLLRLRHLAGVRILDEGDKQPQYTTPDFEALPDGDNLPEIGSKDVTPELLRAGILRDGCLLVRGLIPRDVALAFASQIDRAYEERERKLSGGEAAEGYYEEFELDSRFEPLIVRDWIKQGGGLLAVDSPLLTFEMLEIFQEAGLPRLIEGYLGEPGMISAHKTTLRKAVPSVPGKWHQDGAFMGEVRSINLWLSLSHCGDVAPGLDIVPRRLGELVASEMPDDPNLYYLVSDETAEEVAGDKEIIRPIFEPGDALLFDELFLHQTASDPSMPNPRFAIESWFFSGSAFPAKYAPIAV